MKTLDGLFKNKLLKMFTYLDKMSYFFTNILNRYSQFTVNAGKLMKKLTTLKSVVNFATKTHLAKNDIFQKCSNTA